MSYCLVVYFKVVTFTYLYFFKLAAEQMITFVDSTYLIYETCGLHNGCKFDIGGEGSLSILLWLI